MPIFDDSLVTTFTPRPTVNVVPPPPEPQGGSFLDVMQAAGRTENDIVAAVDLLTQPKQKVDLNFNLLEEAKKRNVDAADYTDALNPAHLDQLIAKRNQEDRDNAMLDQAGWGGFLARVAAGIVSPTTLFPMVGPETTGLKTMLTVGLNAAAGAAMQEGVLYADQRTRTKTQAAYSIGSSMLLGSVLGGIAHTLKPSELARMSHDMANAPEGFAISSPTPSILDAGAKETNNLADAGQLKKGWGAHLLSPLSGITRNFEQWNAPKYIKDLGGAPQVRKMTAGFSQADLILQNNADFIAASRGGNVEQIKRVYNGVSYEGTVALQNAYQDYILGADAKGWFKQGRATLAGSRRPDGKLTWGEFKKQVTEDWMTGQTAVGVPDPVRKAAKEVAEKVYKALYDEGVKYGVFTGKEVPVGDENYINRVYNDEVIMRRRPEFEQILASNYQRQLDKDFGEKLQRLQDAMVKDKQRLSDMQLPLDQAQKLRDDLIHAKVDLTDATNPQVIQGAELLKANAKAVKELTKELDDLRKVKIDVNDLGAYKSRTDRMGEIEAALKQKALEAEGTKKALGDELAKYQKDAAEIRRRLNNLNNNIHIKDTRLKKKLDKIVANEDAQAETILRAQKQLQKFVSMAASASPEKIDAELSKLKNAFEDHAKKFDDFEKELHEIENGDPTKVGKDHEGLPPELIIGDKMDAVAGKMDEVSAKIDQLDAHDPVAFKQEIESMMRDLADTHAKINAKRVLRNEKLWKQVEAMSPEARARKIADLELKAKERPRKFIERFRDTNAGKMAIDSESGLLQGNGDFAAHAKEMAKDTVTKILGSERRLAYSDIIREKRGPELARVLNIPSAEIKDFLEMDMERLMAIYTRTVGADTAIAKVFGSADAAAEFAKLDDEMNSMLAKIETLKDKKGNPLDQKAKEDITKQTHDFYDAARKNLYVLMERAKGMRGIPKDAGSWSARGAKMVMDINFMRLMGNVLISSVADPGRAVMKFGLTRTFRDGLLPMITNLKTLRMSQHEARLAGVALDPVIHSRAAALADIFDDAHRGTKIEKAVHWASTKMGLAAGFDHWTSAIKQFTAGIANAKLLDNISAVMEGKVKGKQLVKAQEYLSKLNIDAEFAERIWKEVTSGEGGGKVNGIWLPNTENWTDREAVLAYRAALGSEVDATIITPGFERPNWVDSSLPAKMMAQFKSFGFTSTQKTLMAGLQEHDLAFMNGVISSLALGALSYYLYGVFTGGKTYTEMMNAGLDKWADEAISRSGVTAIFDEAQRISARVSLLQKYTSFSGRQTTRRGGGDLASEILGPSFDALSRVTKIASEIDSPTKSTLHTVRTLLPLQNIFYLRQLLDKVEAAAGSKLPKKRSAQ